MVKTVAGELGLPEKSVENTVKLLDDGNTVPFIARYRKEMTGELDETQIRRIEEQVGYYRNLEQRKEEVIRLIDEQGKLTEEIKEQINQALKLSEVEDIYRPFRPKRKTRGSIARERGLEPLAGYLLSFPAEGSPEIEAAKYLSEEVPSVEEALQGAMDIIAEDIADDPKVRGWVRDYTRKNGYLVTKAKDPDQDSVYRMYYDFKEPVAKVPSHRVLAINRGEREEFLQVSVDVETEPVISWLNRNYAKEEAVTTDLVKKALADAYKRLIAPAVERDLRGELTEMAHEQAIKVFSKNLRNLLLQPPVRGKMVMGVDPAYRTGCKWAVVDQTGKLLEVGVVYPTPPQQKIEEAEQEFTRVIKQYKIDVIAIGNGTASRETELFVAGLIHKLNKTGLNLAYVIVSEAGASVYSASKLAIKEFPDLDVSQRSAVSIARRLQDPLAELVKIEPKAIGVGQYQHDIPAKQLNESLAKVVESAVNYVGVDLNTASAPLLSYVSGINATVAENIVHYREENGAFRIRNQLTDVPRLGPKAFEQCAGFLRINDGDNLLDSTPIHPESYELTYQLLDLLGVSLDEVGTDALRSKLSGLDVEKTAEKLGAGVPTLRDIIEALLRPGRDPRDDLPQPVFRTDVLSIEDLKPGMQLKGVVRNVVDFGAFVDIGVKNDGLVHISELSEKYIRNPLDVVAVGDVVTVRVLSVDVEKGRIALSMKGIPQEFN
ncbi:MAG TPA: RNA-binding transcriptional accessory protein [Syntrophomonadaceae bacterium]|nr:RNA-binding transcriptional accessory protein [Syntrophomonadaceae bacterium]